jgi:hypothetical protein
MRPVTVKQWEKMPVRTKSWLVVKAFGFWTDVWWHVHADYQTEDTLSGSIRDEKECRRMLKFWLKTKAVPKTAVVRRTLSFWSCAEVLTPAWEVVKALLALGYRVEFSTDNDGTYCILVRPENGVPVHGHVGWGKTLSEAVCASALKAKGLLIQ